MNTNINDIESELDEGKYVFVSYSHKDADVVLPIINLLRRNQVNVWYDDSNEAGDKWAEIIQNHVKKAYCLICFLSDNFVQSQNCRNEITLASNYLPENIIAIHLSTEQTELKYGLELQLCSSHMLYLKQ